MPIDKPMPVPTPPGVGGELITHSDGTRSEGGDPMVPIIGVAPAGDKNRFWYPEPGEWRKYTLGALGTGPGFEAATDTGALPSPDLNEGPFALPEFGSDVCDGCVKLWAGLSAPARADPSAAGGLRLLLLLPLGALARPGGLPELDMGTDAGERRSGAASGRSGSEATIDAEVEEDAEDEEADADDCCDTPA